MTCNQQSYEFSAPPLPFQLLPTDYSKHCTTQMPSLLEPGSWFKKGPLSSRSLAASATSLHPESPESVPGPSHNSGGVHRSSSSNSIADGTDSTAVKDREDSRSLTSYRGGRDNDPSIAKSNSRMSSPEPEDARASECFPHQLMWPILNVPSSGKNQITTGVSFVGRRRPRRMKEGGMRTREGEVRVKVKRRRQGRRIRKRNPQHNTLLILRGKPLGQRPRVISPSIQSELRITTPSHQWDLRVCDGVLVTF